MNAHIPLSPSLESLVAQYASGDLGYGMSVLMASFVTLSPAAREQLNTLEKINGLLLDEAEQVEMADNALDAILDKLDAVAEDETLSLIHI